MNKTKYIYIVVACLILLGSIVVVKPEYRWLIFNGSNAENYAVSLLSSDDVSTPSWAIDLVVIKENGYVTFGEHDSTVIYAYSPQGKPNKSNINWSHTWGSWYAGKTQT